MTDNVNTIPGLVTDPLIATDEIGGVHYQKIKLVLGLADAIDLIVSAGQNTMANSVPVVIANNQSALSTTVSGTVVVDSELPTAAVLADATANPTVPGVGGFLMGYNGATWDRVRTANTGRLQVDVITGGGASTLVDNAAFTDGTTPVTPVGFIYDEVAGTALTENDIAAARVNVNRAQVSVLEDGVTRARYATVSAANALKVDGSAVTQPVSIAATVTVDTELTAVAALADAVANPTITNIASYLVGFNGATWDRVRTANTGRLQVDVITSASLTVADSQTIVDNAAFTDGTSKLFMAGYIFDEVAGTALTENDAAAGRVNANRAQVFAIEDGATRARYATVSAANALKVDGSAVTQPISSTQLPAALVGGRLDDNIGSWMGSTAPTVGSKTSANSIPVVIASDQAAVAVTGTLTAVTSITNTVTVAGNKTNNNAAPGATNVGALVGIANAAAPTYIEGNEVLLSTDLTGAVRVTGSLSVGGKNEDSVAADGDAGSVLLSVRNDIDVVNTSASGDYSWVTSDQYGHLKTRDAETANITTLLTIMTTQLDALNSNLTGLPPVIANQYTINNPLPITIEPTIPGGYNTFELVSAATTNATLVKTGTGCLFGWQIYNTNAAARYVKFYDSNLSQAAGFKPKLSILIPGAAAGAGNNFDAAVGIPFNSGISFVTVTGAADSDTTAVAANDLIINLMYM